DRLHNLRTLSSMRPDKQMKIAGETDYFYAPLANRLGLHKIKTELENLSFRFRCPREFATLEEALRKERAEREKYINGFMKNITRVLASHGLDVRTQLRYRAPYKVWRKMYTSGCDFHHIDDKYYVRIIYGNVPGMSEKDVCLKIYSILTDVYKERPHSVNNYIDSPKENGYQSFHVKLLGDKGVWEEIHISSERMVKKSQFGCIAERSEGNIVNWIEKFKSVLQDVACHGKEVEYMEGVTMSFYNDDIMVYTPQGMYVILPKNATALDFAFEIHSNIGKHAQYAKINGRLCSVKTVLRRGDCVEIGTNDSIEPRPDWLDHVVTYKAKRNLRTMLNRQKKISYIRCPNCRPLPGDEVIGFKDRFDKITLHRRDCRSAIRQASQDGDAIVAVNFEEDCDFLYPACISIYAIDRYHLLIDLVDCVTNKLKLSIISISSTTEDEIVNCTIEFNVHSSRELHEVIEHISAIAGVDEVKQKFIER
ncbi:MAG: bifunctional (p)ppGpp synthetase/guanosine-3',5'-bis(diphosphate) 3'-pyrophosphohydrolase, partial [Bacteroidaceae bacterium]|nr:bifunctional (p)ppGpp synthetase/guanosine-3',5'-bis(diphosphate) 3'-pyrophosphohydrolase [Bacteroidaceae bacterium]